MQEHEARSQLRDQIETALSLSAMRYAQADIDDLERLVSEDLDSGDHQPPEFSAIFKVAMLLQNGVARTPVLCAAGCHGMPRPASPDFYGPSRGHSDTTFLTSPVGRLPLWRIPLPQLVLEYSARKARETGDLEPMKAVVASMHGFRQNLESVGVAPLPVSLTLFLVPLPPRHSSNHSLFCRAVLVSTSACHCADFDNVAGVRRRPDEGWTPHSPFLSYSTRPPPPLPAFSTHFTLFPRPRHVAQMLGSLQDAIAQGSQSAANVLAFLGGGEAGGLPPPHTSLDRPSLRTPSGCTRAVQGLIAQVLATREGHAFPAVVRSCPSPRCHAVWLSRFSWVMGTGARACIGARGGVLCPVDDLVFVSRIACGTLARAGTACRRAVKQRRPRGHDSRRRHRRRR